MTREVPEHFIGRVQHLDWFAKLLFSHRHWHMPFLVIGPPGSGKTTLVAKFLQLNQDKVRGYWTSISKPSHMEDFYKLMERDLSGNRRVKPIIVVLDDVGHLEDKLLLELSMMLYNYKIVQAVVITSDRKVSIDKAPVLAIKGIGRYEVEEMLRYADVEMPSHVVEELVLRIGSKATMLPLIAGALKSEGIDGLAKLLKLPLYSVTDEIPTGKIISLAKPALIYVTDQLIEELKRRPESIYDLSPRRFEELLADLLVDQGMEVQLTQETRDGGRDIIAEYNTPAGRILCLVDAKKYRRDRTIGVGLIRQLHGTLCDHKATTAMMITTSTYSPDAHAYQRRHKWQLSLRDYNDVIELLGKYKKTKTGLILPNDSNAI
jgi:restriction system protein